MPTSSCSETEGEPGARLDTMIDNQLVTAYIAELDALRNHARDFAERFPEVASRLDIGPRESQDAHVERVVQSAAFLAARLRNMVEANATELPLAILSLLAPALLDPVPSMAIVQLSGGTEEEAVPARTRLDADMGGSPVCFSTAMAFTAAPLAIRTDRLPAGGNYADGISIRVDRGATPDPWLLYLGSDQRTGAILMDALDEALERIEMVSPDGTVRTLPRATVRIHGFDDVDALLPVRRAMHRAHRLLVEFLTFQERFRFISINGAVLTTGAELRLLFRTPVPLPFPLPPGLVNVNCVPAVNLWKAAGTPLEVSGRELEYRVKVDALRYRTVECHSVEAVDLYASNNSQSYPIDPIIAGGQVRGTEIRWGTRRKAVRDGGEVLLYFQGIDYGMLGQVRLLATPEVLASNRNFAAYVRPGQTLVPLDGLGSWHGVMHSAPTRYRHPVSGEEAMRTLISHLNSSMSGLTSDNGGGILRNFLKRFPGGADATWIDSLGNATLEPVAVLRGGEPQSGVAVSIAFDRASQPTTSRAMLRRVLARLLEGQRGLNRVEQVRLVV